MKSDFDTQIHDLPEYRGPVEKRGLAGRVHTSGTCKVSAIPSFGQSGEGADCIRLQVCDVTTLDKFPKEGYYRAINNALDQG